MIRTSILKSPALIVALLALTVSMTGVSYAALKLKKNSVGTKQLRNDAVKNPKIADAAVGSAEVADGALARADAARGTLVAGYARINNGAGASSVASNTAVNVVDTDDIGADGTGNVIVSFNPASLPGGSLANCTLTVQAIALANMGGLVDLNAAVATGGNFLAASAAQVQTFNAVGGVADLDFYIQANCPPG